MNKELSKKGKVYKKTKPIVELTYEENKKIAIELVNKVFPEQKGKNIVWKDIHNGYTNFSFLITFEDGSQYQVRLPHDGNIINRSVEHDILSTYLKDKNFVYFDSKTGRAIKKWLPGKAPSKFTCGKGWFQDILFKKIKAIHSLPLKKGHKFTPIKFDTYNENLYRLKFSWKKKFLCLIDRRRDDALVINHTDINPLNIIYNKQNKSVELIDFEWVGLSNDYYDYANFIRETGIDYKKIAWSKYIKDFNMDIFQQYIYMTSVYAYLWTFAMPQTKKMIKYRFKTYKQIRKYFPCVVNIDKCSYISTGENNDAQEE